VGIRREGGLRGEENEKNAHVEHVERVQVHVPAVGASRGCQPWVPAVGASQSEAAVRVAGRECVFCEVDCRADVSGLWLSCRCPVAVLSLYLVAVLSSGGDLRGGRTEGGQALAQCSPSRPCRAQSSAQPSMARSFYFG
jgi:hypothetical protein